MYIQYVDPCERGVKEMKYYYGSNIDAQGRIALGTVGSQYSQVVFYIEDECEDIVYLEAYKPESGLPANCARKIDSKYRVCLPKWLQKDYNRVLIGYREDSIVLKMIKQ